MLCLCQELLLILLFGSMFYSTYNVKWLIYINIGYELLWADVHSYYLSVSFTYNYLCNSETPTNQPKRYIIISEYIYICIYIYIYNIADTKVQFTKNLIGFILLGISLIVSFVVCITIDGVLVNEEEREGWTTVVVTGIILDFMFVQTLKCVLIYAILNLQFRSAFLLMTSGYSIL